MDLETLVQRAETIALDSLDHVDDFRPRQYEAAPPTLRKHLDGYRSAMGARRHEQARRELIAALADPAVRQELSIYREHVTWVEKENAARLASLCWVYQTLIPRASEGDHELMRKLVVLESLAVDEYRASGIQTERGWAEQQTTRHDLVPQAWRVP